MHRGLPALTLHPARFARYLCERLPADASMVAALEQLRTIDVNEALGALTPRQRTLLRLHLVKGLSADRLARMYGVHRATTTRWLADARAWVLTHVPRRCRAA